MALTSQGHPVVYELGSTVDIISTPSNPENKPQPVAIGSYLVRDVEDATGYKHVNLLECTGLLANEPPKLLILDIPKKDSIAIASATSCTPILKKGGCYVIESPIFGDSNCYSGRFQ